MSDIRIIPNRTTGEPVMIFSPSGTATSDINLYVLTSATGLTDTGVATLSFEGSQGQLFSITDQLESGVIFSVNDIGGLPLIEADASGYVYLARYGETVGVGQSINSGVRFLVNPGLASRMGIVITGVAGQTADYFEIVNSTNNMLFAVTANGNTVIGSGIAGARLDVVDTGSNLTPTLRLMNLNANDDPYVRFTPAITGNSFSLGIDDSDSDKFKLSFNSQLGTNDRLTIATGGQVGINNSSPAASLDLNTLSSSTKGMILKGSAAQSANLLELQNNAGSIISVFDNNGNLGIGTGVVNSKLQVVGNDNAVIASFTDGVDGLEIATVGTSRQQINFLGSNDSVINAKGSLFLTCDSDNSGPSDAIYFGRNNSGSAATIDMIINEGLVGINTGNPSARLHVLTNINNGLTALFEQIHGSPQSIPVIRLSRRNNIGSPTTSGASLHIIDHPTNIPFHIETHVGNPIFTITGNGNVGLGISNPTAKLHLLGTAEQRIFIQSTGNAVIQFGGLNNQNPFNITHDGTDWTLTEGTRNRIRVRNAGDISIFSRDASGIATERLTIKDLNGRIGIGTTNPQGLLDVNGGTSIFQNTGDENTVRAVNINPASRATFQLQNNTAVIGGIAAHGTGSSASWGGLNTNRVVVYASSNSNGLNLVADGGNSITFCTSGYSFANQRAVITASGTFGINTTTPNYILDVNGVGNFSSGVRYPDGLTQVIAYTGLNGIATSGYVNQISGALDTRLVATGSSLQSQINSVSGLLYNYWTLNITGSNDQITKEQTVTFTGAGSTSVSYNSSTNTITISSTDNNTTYSAGTGLNLVGNTFNVSGSTTSNSGIVQLQDSIQDNIINRAVTPNAVFDYVASTSGALDTRLIATGNDLASRINTLSGNVITTGSNLQSQINSVSGSLYNFWTLIAPGAAADNITRQQSVTFTGTGATTVSYNTGTNVLTISSTDTNTTYSAGTGLNLVGTIFNVSGSTTSNSGIVQLQDSIQDNVTNRAVTPNAVFDYVGGVSGALDTRLNTTGNTLIDLINGKDNYQYWTLRGDAATTTQVDTTETVQFTGAGNVSVTLGGTDNRTVTISGIDSNTTYNAGSGLQLIGDTFHLGGTGELSSLLFNNNKIRIGNIIPVSHIPDKSIIIGDILKNANSSGSIGMSWPAVILGNDTLLNFSGEVTIPTLIGYGALRNSSGNNNIHNTPIFLGYSVGYGAINSDNTILIGVSAGQEFHDSFDSYIIGTYGGYKSSGCAANICMGYFTSPYNTGSTYNINLGAYAGSYHQNTIGCIAIGQYTSIARMNSNYSISIGDNAHGSTFPTYFSNIPTTFYKSDNAIAIGYYSSYESPETSYNISLGNYTNSFASGTYNVFIGSYAGAEATGNNNLEIVTSGNTSSIIGNNSNKIHINNVLAGDTSTKRLAIGSVGTANLNPNATLEILPNSSTDKVLIVKGAASQTANLTEWQNSIGNSLAIIDNNAQLRLGTGSPSYKLDVDGIGNFTSGVRYPDGLTQVIAYTGLNGIATSGYVQSVSGAIDTRLIATGNNLQGQINSVSGLLYNHWTLIAPGASPDNITSQQSVTFTGTGATSVSYNASTNILTITSTDTNTTYTAGTGLNIIGTIFNVSGSTINNSGIVQLQDSIQDNIVNRAVTPNAVFDYVATTSGDINTRIIATGNNLQTQINNISGLTRGPASGIVFFAPNGALTGISNRFIYDSGNSRLSIGTGVFGAVLDIADTGANVLPTLRLTNLANNFDPYIRFTPSTTGNSFAVGIDDSDGDKFKISYGPELGTGLGITISTSGHVGINNTTPIYPLHVSGVAVFTETIVGGIFEENASDENIKDYLTGTLLVLDKEGNLVPCYKDHDTMVFGVAKHGYKQPIVFGAEPMLVTGKVEVGDYIVTSNKIGHGMSKVYDKYGIVIGQAMESGDGYSHTIKVMIRKM